LIPYRENSYLVTASFNVVRIPWNWLNINICRKVIIVTICHLLFVFFWVIPRRLKFIRRRFGKLCLFHLHRQVVACRILHAPTCLWKWNRQSVSKRRHIKFRRRGITQKKANNIQDTANICHFVTFLQHISDYEGHVQEEFSYKVTHLWKNVVTSLTTFCHKCITL